jgi:hypothetical protein
MDIAKAKEEYQTIINGKAGHWFDPGEYEHLIQEWFKKYALELIKIAETKC